MRSNGHAADVRYATTEDDWRLALHHRGHGRGRSKRPPVILLPGLGSNSCNVDFPIPRFSLARYLHDQGYDTWAVNLRGMGLSHRPGFWNRFRYDWNFDDYAFKDLPALYHYIREVTGHERAHWIGHSLGGMLVLAALELLGNRVAASAVTIASAVSAEDKPGFIKNLMKFDSLLKYLPVFPAKPIGRLVAPLIRHIAPFYDNFYCCTDNMDDAVMSLGSRVAVDNVPVKLALQIHTWYRENHFRAVDSSRYSYSGNLKKVTAPLLVIAGSADGMTPVHDVRYAFNRVRSRQKKFVIFGKDHGHRSEYAHIDLVLGKHAPAEVYPAIADWIGKFP